MITMQKFYTCKYDRAFKEVFGKEENKDILTKLLESILKVEINEIKYLNVERNSGNIYVKGKRFDLYLNTNIGKIQVEVNSETNKYIHPRNMGYICNTYAIYILIGEEYEEDTKIIQINLSYGLKDPKKIRIYRVQDSEEKLYVENMYIYEINMEKYKEIWYSKNEKEINDSKYLIMLDLETEDLKKLSKKDKEIKRYMEEIKRVNEDSEFYEYMSAEEDARKIQNSLRKEWREEALTEGLEKGIKEGIKEGIKKGVKEGKIEGKREQSISIAKSLLKNNIDIGIISESTGLSIKELEMLN